MGSFVINKKDLNNFEGFPIWKIEAGKMMRKYELFIDKGEIFHRSLSTVSSRKYALFIDKTDNFVVLFLDSVTNCIAGY
jgi:hypothetical protein